jgi:hypothetical protein
MEESMWFIRDGSSKGRGLNHTTTYENEDARVDTIHGQSSTGIDSKSIRAIIPQQVFSLVVTCNVLDHPGGFDNLHFHVPLDGGSVQIVSFPMMPNKLLQTIHSHRWSTGPFSDGVFQGSTLSFMVAPDSTDPYENNWPGALSASISSMHMNKGMGLSLFLQKASLIDQANFHSPIFEAMQERLEALQTPHGLKPVPDPITVFPERGQHYLLLANPPTSIAEYQADFKAEIRWLFSLRAMRAAASPRQLSGGPPPSSPPTEFFVSQVLCVMPTDPTSAQRKLWGCVVWLQDFLEDDPVGTLALIEGIDPARARRLIPFLYMLGDRFTLFAATWYKLLDPGVGGLTPAELSAALLCLGFESYATEKMLGADDEESVVAKHWADIVARESELIPIV